LSVTDELQSAFLTADLTDAQRDQLVSAGQERPFAPGEELFTENQPASHLWVLLEGEIELSRRIASRTVVMATMSSPGQWAGGLAAWGGEEEGYRASGRGLTDGRCFLVPASALAELVAEWSPFAKHMITGVYNTIRSIDSAARERESLVALGTLAAGLAHEINNPASASMRAVEGLRDTSEYMIASLSELAEQAIAAEQFLALDQLRADLQGRPVLSETGLARADREEVLGTWLEDHDVGIAWRLASVLAASGADREWLAAVQDAVGADALSPALRWVTSTVGMATILSELADATSRISHLVEDVKTYSSLDRAELRAIDLTAGINSTLTMLATKLAGVQVEKDYATDLPQVDAYAAELNQVWTNLIDNAVQAMGGQGVLRIATRRDGSCVTVEVTDSGPGIPPDVLARVFEPFFTTKDVGEGTGLGLDISRRIIERHDGDIGFDSQPGSTTAWVRLPIVRTDA
jgi:signal transduction histidine kinase